MRRLVVLAVIAAVALVPSAAAKPPPLDYVALGDSVASGHGLMDNGGPCRRSSRAYPRLALAELRERRGPVRFAFLACSGATAAGGLAIQVDRALAFLRQRRDRPALVTLTVGINDFGWSDIVATYLRLREPDAQAFEGWLESVASEAAGEVRVQLRRLLKRPGVRVVVTEYPNPVNRGSVLFAGPAPCADTAGCYARTELVVHELNEALGRLTGRRVRLARVHEAFHGHEAPAPGCGDASPGVPDTWFQHPDDAESNSFPALPPFVTGGWRGDCFHPNARGAEAFASAVDSAAHALGR